MVEACWLCWSELIVLIMHVLLLLWSIEFVVIMASSFFVSLVMVVCYTEFLVSFFYEIVLVLCNCAYSSFYCDVTLVFVTYLWHSVQYLLMTRWISYLLHGEYLLFIARWISCLLHGEYLLFIARWISEAPCVISWLSYDSRDVISTWWRQIWRRYGKYGSYGTVWYELSCVCIVL